MDGQDAQDQQDTDLMQTPLSPVLTRRSAFVRKPLKKRPKIETTLALDDDDFTPSQTENLLQTIESFESNVKVPDEVPNPTVASADSDYLFPKDCKPDLKNGNDQQGHPFFQTAAGRKIVISKEQTEKHSNLFDDILNDSSSRFNKHSFLSKSSKTVERIKSIEVNNAPSTVMFKSASEKHIFLNKANNIFGDEDFSDLYGENQENIPEKNFSNTNKSVELIGTANIEEDFKGFNAKEIDESLGIMVDVKEALKLIQTDQVSNKKRSQTNDEFQSHKRIKISTDTEDRRDSDISTKQPIESGLKGFSTASGKAININNAALSKGKSLMSDFEEMGKSYEDPKFLASSSTFATASGKSININKNLLSKAMDIFGEDMTAVSYESEFTDEPSTSRETTDLVNNKNLEIGNQNLTPQKTFNKFKSPLLSKPEPSISKTPINVAKKRLGMSRCKQFQLPEEQIRKASSVFKNTPLPISPIISKTSSNNSSPARYIPSSTPSKTSFPINSSYAGPHLKKGNISMQPCTKGDLDVWIKDVEVQSQELQKQIFLLNQKHKALKSQKQAIEHPELKSKRHFGVLYNRKQRADKMKLFMLKIDPDPVRTSIITPQNADLVHFICPEMNPPLIRTSDEAVVIPNNRNLIGLSEIETAFKAMPCVEVKLIPKNWIKNHYKLIVWKLSSYESFFQNFTGCLTVENIIQQLKYRYDREIEKAERSHLRKILEKDDVPQKRMALCVSNIIKTGDKVELELSDGWYCIKTSIDEPLTKQVNNNKIVIGTKLLIGGAELLNCEGCHPLEATDLIRLKITANSTRRAIWHLKLGYQQCPLPFQIKLDSILENGGVVGAVKVRILRTYPSKYLEKQGNNSVWRNQKAEEKRAREWDNERCKAIEKCRQEVLKAHEKTNFGEITGGNLSRKDLSDVSCPESLYQVYMKSKDPENLQNMLSPSQKQSIVEYQNYIAQKRQSQINAEIENKIAKLDLSKRNVSTVLTLLVNDALVENPEKSVFLQIWYPTSSNQEMLKEGSVFSVFNLIPKKNGNLNTFKRTQFKPEKPSEDLNIFKRELLPIFKTSVAIMPTFKQFDTVGIIVQLSVNTFDQLLWLADCSERLLFIKVFDPPKNCCLFDNMENGSVIGISNLLWAQPKFGFGEAIANHLTIVSKYPNAKHLKEGIEICNRNLPKDLDVFLESCNQRITKYLDQVSTLSGHKNSSSLIHRDRIIEDLHWGR